MAVALFIGTIELLQVSTTNLGLEGGVWGFIQDLDFGPLGYIVVAMFVVAWAISYVIWRFGRVEERWSSAFVGSSNDGGRKRTPEE